MSGLNLDGKKGGQMFTVSSLEAVENPTNRSNVGVAVFVTDPDKITNDEVPQPGSYRGRLSSEPENTRKTLIGNKNA